MQKMDGLESGTVDGCYKNFQIQLARCVESDEVKNVANIREYRGRSGSEKSAAD